MSAIINSIQCVLCQGLCENEYGNNSYPLSETGVCCNTCNVKVVEERLRFSMSHEGLFWLQKNALEKARVETGIYECNTCQEDFDRNDPVWDAMGIKNSNFCVGCQLDYEETTLAEHRDEYGSDDDLTYTDSEGEQACVYCNQAGCENRACSSYPSGATLCLTHAIRYDQKLDEIKMNDICETIEINEDPNP